MSSIRDRAVSQALKNFEDYTLCPVGIADCLALSEARTPQAGESATFDGAGDPTSWIRRLADSADASPEAIDDAIHFLRLEKYIDNSIEQTRQHPLKRAVREAYYKLRPAFPVAFRKYLQRIALQGWNTRPFPNWPVDVTVERLVAGLWRRALSAHGVEELPFIWFWPDGAPAACIVTHDVETAAGRDFCGDLMEMEARHGIVSAFEVVPEERYAVPPAFLQSIRDNGCEVCIHSLNHDGRLFTSREIFESRVGAIRKYAHDWGAVGFRADVMYRNLDWLPELGFSYDMSVPNVGHLDPQPGGCCTVMPYFIGSLVELPLTTIQDYSLFNILQQRSTELWKTQIERVTAANGLLSFIIHPDYVNEEWSSGVYLSLLESLARLRDDSGTWFALPREVNDWWRARQALRLEKAGSEWRIVGPGAHRARIAFARVEDGAVRYRVARAASPRPDAQTGLPGTTSQN